MRHPQSLSRRFRLRFASLGPGDMLSCVSVTATFQRRMTDSHEVLLVTSLHEDLVHTHRHITTKAPRDQGPAGSSVWKLRDSNACQTRWMKASGRAFGKTDRKRNEGQTGLRKAQALVAGNGRDEVRGRKQKPPNRPNRAPSPSSCSFLHTIPQHATKQDTGHATMTASLLVTMYQRRYKTRLPRSTKLHSAHITTYTPQISTPHVLHFHLV